MMDEPRNDPEGGKKMPWDLLANAAHLAEKSCTCSCSCTCNCDGVFNLNIDDRALAAGAASGGTAAGNAIGDPQQVQMLR
jgi:hypothetical protein